MKKYLNLIVIILLVISVIGTLYCASHRVTIPTGVYLLFLYTMPVAPLFFLVKSYIDYYKKEAKRGRKHRNKAIMVGAIIVVVSVLVFVVIRVFELRITGNYGTF
jgi:glucose-6-phosphate-specific signal transduction histidine kinase